MNVITRCPDCNVEWPYGSDTPTCTDSNHGRQVYDRDEEIPAEAVHEGPGPAYAWPMEPPAGDQPEPLAEPAPGGPQPEPLPVAEPAED